MAYQALATPETGANPTGTASVSANGNDRASIVNETAQKIKKTGNGAASRGQHSANGWTFGRQTANWHRTLSSSLLYGSPETPKFWP